MRKMLYLCKGTRHILDPCLDRDCIGIELPEIPSIELWPGESLRDHGWQAIDDDSKRYSLQGGLIQLCPDCVEYFLKRPADARRSDEARFNLDGLVG